MPGGKRISFTRSEKRALAVLVRHPNRILTRDQILDAVTGSGSDNGDRNIDFLVNRLRRKLSDNAREPRFIATRYGEGYVWIGGAPSVDANYAAAYLIVGPLKGIDNLDDRRNLGMKFCITDQKSDLNFDRKSLTLNYNLKYLPQILTENVTPGRNKKI